MTSVCLLIGYKQYMGYRYHDTRVHLLENAYYLFERVEQHAFYLLFSVTTSEYVS